MGAALVQVVIQGALVRDVGVKGQSEDVARDLRSQFLCLIASLSHTYNIIPLSIRFSHHLRCHSAQLT